MMSIITLEIARAHLRADDSDDNLIQIYLDAAEEQASEFMGRKIYATQDDLNAAGGGAGDRPIVINASIKAAVLLTLGHLYTNREGNVTGSIVSELKEPSKALLMPFRINMGV